MDASGKHLQCVVVTPERAVLDQAAGFVALPMYDGELGILPGRAPFIGRLGAGELRVRRAGSVDRFFVEGGFVQVRGDVVTVLTQRAIRAADIDGRAAAQALEAALAPASAGQGAETRLKAQERARAQLRVAEHARAAPAERPRSEA